MAKQQFIGNLRQAPVWLKDFGNREHVLPIPAKVDPAQFTDQAGVTVTVGVAGAAQNATSVPVAALTPSVLANTTLIAGGGVLIPSGTVLYFGGAKVAQLTADAKIGDTALTVAALPTALVSADAATYSAYATKAVSSGTLLGRTFAERDAFTAYGPAATTDDEIFLAWNDNPDVTFNADVELVRHGSVIAENLLPSYATISAGVNEAQTVTISGTPTGGTFTLTYKGATTTGLAFNASAATVQTALQALATIGASNATVSGSNGGPYTVTFAAALAGAAQDLLSADPGGLTGGTPAIVVARTVAGGTALLTKLRSLYRCIVGAQ